MIRFLFGLALIGAAVVALVATAAQNVNESPALADLLTQAFCQPGERVEQTYSGIGSTSGSGFMINNRYVYYYCINDAGGAREITGQVVTLIMTAFIGPLLLGILFIVWGSIGMARRATRRAFAQLDSLGGAVITQAGADGQPVVIRTGGAGGRGVTHTVVSVSGQTLDSANLPPETARMMQQLLDGLSGAGFNAAAMNSGDDLADRLEQLKEARDKGLISGDEYERVRQQILDSLKG